METLLHGAPRTLHETLIRPFEPLTIKRSMTLFPTALGLHPGRRALPSDEFLANLLSGRRTHLAFIRRGFGRDYKNFENYALQRVHTTAEVRQRLIHAVGGEEQLLELLSQNLRSGVLARQLASVTRAVEGLVYQLVSALSSGSCKCTNCGTELVSRPDAWWSSQRCVLGEAEYRFVDRILYDLLAMVQVPLIFGGDWSQRHRAIESLASFCDPGGHPFKHWLGQVQRAFRAKDLTALAVRAGLEGQYPDSHLQRCSRGEMLTVETIQEVTARLAKPGDLRNQGMHARAVAFAIDFLVAADCSQDLLPWQDAQAIIRARIHQLASDLWLSTSKKLRPVPAPLSKQEPLERVGRSVQR